MPFPCRFRKCRSNDASVPKVLPQTQVNGTGTKRGAAARMLDVVVGATASVGTAGPLMASSWLLTFGVRAAASAGLVADGLLVPVASGHSGEHWSEGSHLASSKKLSSASGSDFLIASVFAVKLVYC